MVAVYRLDPIVTIFGQNSELRLFHVGLVVPDLTRAITEWGALLDVRFAPANSVHLSVRVDGEQRQVELSATYSTTGPIHLELIEEHAGTTWASTAYGLNHLGFFVPDVDAASTRLKRLGFPERLAILGRDQGAGPRLHATDSGIWIELVQSSFEPALANWLGSDSDQKRADV